MSNKNKIELTNVHAPFPDTMSFIVGIIGGAFDKHHKYPVGKDVEIWAKIIKSASVEHGNLVLETTNSIWCITSYNETSTITKEASKNSVYTVLKNIDMHIRDPH